MMIDEAEEYISSIVDTYEMCHDTEHKWVAIPIDAEDIKALEMAIASLKAWDKVKQEINDLFNKPAFYMPNYDAYKMFLEIIDKHLQKVEE